MVLDASKTDPQTDAPVLSDSGSEDAGHAWFDRLVRPFRSAPNQPQPSTAPNGDAQAAPKSSGEQPKPTETAAPKTIVLTEEEHAERVRREAQAMKDKELAREAEAKKREERERRRKEVSELKDNNVYKYAEERDKLDQEEQEEARVNAEREALNTQVTTMLKGVVQQFDDGVLKPLTDRLPLEDRQRIFNDAPAAGLENRQYVTEKSLEFLLDQARKEGEASARAKLEKNPAFKKQLLASRREEEDEPDLAPGAMNGGFSPNDMNSVLRAAAGVIPRFS